MNNLNENIGMTAITDASIRTQIWQPGMRADHPKYGRLTIEKVSVTGLHVRFDSIPEELDDDEDVICAEDLKGQIPLGPNDQATVQETNPRKDPPAVGHFRMLFEPTDLICLTFIRRETGETENGFILA